MASVFDVAAYVLTKKAPISAMKLQKLVYYAQAWSLVWDEKPLFSERIEAWAYGPVIPELYREHKGKFMLSQGDIKGDPSVLTDSERETVDVVLKAYGDKSSQWLSDLSHIEPPWKDARRGLGPMDRGAKVISLAALAEYFGTIPTGAG
jgi:uncharacterized phage-associated protein